MLFKFLTFLLPLGIPFTLMVFAWFFSGKSTGSWFLITWPLILVFALIVAFTSGFGFLDPTLAVLVSLVLLVTSILLAAGLALAYSPSSNNTPAKCVAKATKEAYGAYQQMDPDAKQRLHQVAGFCTKVGLHSLAGFLSKTGHPHVARAARKASRVF